MCVFVLTRVRSNYGKFLYKSRKAVKMTSHVTIAFVVGLAVKFAKHIAFNIPQKKAEERLFFSVTAVCKLLFTIYKLTNAAL